MGPKTPSTEATLTITTTSGTTLKLSQLQNLAKRDPVAYAEDYQAQVRRLESELGILQLSPSTEPTTSLTELMQFCSAVSSSSYKGVESDRIASLLIRLLVGDEGTDGNAKGASSVPVMINNSSSIPALQLHRDVRKTAVSALILMRNKGSIEPLRLLPLFFRILSIVPDKALREILYRHVVNDIRNINKKGKRDETVNRAVQSFLHKIIATHGTPSNASTEQSATDVAAKRATDLVCELYRRAVWTDDRVVAILASAVESPNLTVACRALRFFLNIEDKMAADAQQKQEQQWEANRTVDFHLHSKKTKGRQRQTERQLKTRKRAQLQKEAANSDWMDVTPDQDQGVEASKKLYPAIELLRDPQGLAESVLKRVRTGGSLKYEAKLLMINFVTRLVGNHELLLLPLYPFLQKYLSGHQRDVTVVLAYTVQACHEQVPPYEVYGLLKTIAHNFITERCTEEQMAVGINAARAICARVPAVFVVESREEMLEMPSATYMDIEAFTRDLAGFANHRDRSVSIAGKAWVNLVRQLHPSLLQGKSRGMKGTALHRAGTKPLRYGERRVASGVEGADLLLEYEAQRAARRELEEKGTGGDEEDNDNDAEVDDEEVDSDDEEEEIEEEDRLGEEEDVEGSDDDEAPQLVVHEPEKIKKNVSEGVIPKVANLSREERDKIKQEVSSTRIFSTSDFIKMRKLVERENRLKQDPREAARRKRAAARGEDYDALSEDDEIDSEDEDEEDAVQISGAVRPTELMAEAKRKRMSKAEKLQKIIAGRSEFETRHREGGSTNIEKKRRKNFVMSKFSREARAKGRGKPTATKKHGGKHQMGHEARKRRRKM